MGYGTFYVSNKVLYTYYLTYKWRVIFQKGTFSFKHLF